MRENKRGYRYAYARKYSFANYVRDKGRSNGHADSAQCRKCDESGARKQDKYPLMLQ